MEKIPTAKEFAQQFNFWTTYYREHTIDHVEVHRFAIEYTKLHVKAALEAGYEELLKSVDNIDSSIDPKKIILNAYPLNLIQ
jgi:hypothetical protein